MMHKIQPAFCTKDDLIIEPEWIDYNGHLNMGYYTVLFDRASDAVFEAMGLGADYLNARGMTFYTVECHIRYLSELKLGDPIIATFQLIKHDVKCVKAVQHLYHKDGWLAATAEVLWLHVDQSSEKPKVTPFPEDIKSNFDALAKEHNKLEKPNFIGKPVGVRS